MARSVIIDDDEKNIDVLKALLSRACPQVIVCGQAANAEEGIEVINELKPELVFLDIEMPYGNAFDMLDRLKPVEFEIIFITAFNEYTLKAFRYSALDYLLKPVNMVELAAAVDKASRAIALKDINHRLENFFNNRNQPSYSNHRIALPVRDGYDFVDMTDIVRCEALNNCTVILLKTKQKYTCSKTLKEYEEMLPSSLFFRIHHSHLVNLGCIKKYYKQGRGGYIELMDGSTLEVAYRRKDEFLKLFGYR